MISQTDLQEKIIELKNKKNALILSHFYQTYDIQSVADFVGDSFELSKKAKYSDNELIIFCGVRFMAESAKLLSPHKKIMIPEINAGCPMADMVTPEIIRSLRDKYPAAGVMCYVNSSVKTKAESDICCTSSNAVRVAKSMKQQEIIFVPDKNLGAYIASMVSEKTFHFMDGYCPIHNKITVSDVRAKKNDFPNAKFAVHPECTGDVLEYADFIGSTSEILKFCSDSPYTEYIVGTEYGVVERLRMTHPRKNFQIVSPTFICPNMKKITLEKLHTALTDEKYEINLSSEIIERANIPLERMLLV